MLFELNRNRRSLAIWSTSCLSLPDYRNMTAIDAGKSPVFSLCLHTYNLIYTSNTRLFCLSYLKTWQIRQNLRRRPPRPSRICNRTPPESRRLQQSHPPVTHRTRSHQPIRSQNLLLSRKTSIRDPRSRQSRWNPRQQHLPRRFHHHQPPNPNKRNRLRLSLWYQKTPLLRFFLHLP